MKIDVSKIEGYSDLSLEDKLAALEAYEIDSSPDNTEVERLKAAVSKANSEAANYKKQLRERMTEAETEEAERQAREAEQEANRKAEQENMLAELEALRKEKAVTEHKARYLALGYDESLAAETADAFAAGDMDKVFKNQSTFIQNREAAIRAENIKNMPVPEHLEPVDKEPYVPPAII